MGPLCFEAAFRPEAGQLVIVKRALHFAAPVAVLDLDAVVGRREQIDLVPPLLDEAVEGIDDSAEEVHYPRADLGGCLFEVDDLLVPELHLPVVEARLRERGWAGKELTPYDDLYYRRWTHELPPISHAERGVEVDLHHAILMRTARLKPASELLFADARAVAGSRYAVLAPADMVLHAIVHLFYGGEMDDGLRDLVDIADLLEHFGATEPGFWDGFWHRAEALDVTRPAWYALRYVQQLLGTRVPGHVSGAAEAAAPAPVMRAVMDRAVPLALLPAHPDVPCRASERARLALYVRSHWVKMPPLMLARHLSYKYFMRRVRRAEQDSKSP